jgi:hypothetical protein
MPMNDRFMHRQTQNIVAQHGPRITSLDSNVDEVMKDLDNLELSAEDIARKWEVSEYKFNQFCKRHEVNLTIRYEAYRDRKHKLKELQKAKLPEDTRRWLGREHTMCGGTMSLKAATLPWSRMAEAIEPK